MSADTIPADVQVLAKIETFEKDYAGSIYIGGAHLNRHLWPLLQEVRAILTDRSTRPAEPAAPVAEAGDGETYYTKGKDADWFEGLSHQDAAWALTCAAMDLNDTGLGDHVDLFMPHNAMLSGAGDRIKNLCSALEAERARADAAEQRAADALARAEKAERALETAQEERKAASEAMRHVGAHFPECAAEFDAVMDRKAARASREAQPATDGGDNG